MPDQIKNLRPMECVVRVLGFGVTETALRLCEWRHRHPAFVPDQRYSLGAYEAGFKALNEKLSEVKGEGEKPNLSASPKAEKPRAKTLPGSRQARKMIEAAIMNDDVF